MKDHYSLLASFYNHLTKLVFGYQLKWAKNCFVQNLPRKRILIIGGGDGFDYKELQHQLSGEFWEISQSMLRLAEINLYNSQLNFQLGDFQAEEGNLFDEIWLHFVLDTMNDEEIVSLLREIKKSIQPEGRIYVADFFTPKDGFQRLVNRIMISFFRIVTNHKRVNLPDYEQLLQSNDWEKTMEEEFLKGWVKAQIWTLPAGT